MFENPRKGRQARNFTTNVPKIVDLKSSSEQIFSENWRWVPMFRNDEETGAEIYTAIVSGIVTGDAPVSYWPLFPMPLLRVPEAFTTVNLAQFPSRFWGGELSAVPCEPAPTATEKYTEESKKSVSASWEMYPLSLGVLVFSTDLSSCFM